MDKPNWKAGDAFNACNWYEDVLPAWVLDAGHCPISAYSEPMYAEDGTLVTVHDGYEYAELTVYVTTTGRIVFEYYREGEGIWQGNPENGEHIVYYELQCADVYAALWQAEHVLQTIETTLPEELVLAGWQKIEV